MFSRIPQHRMISSVFGAGLAAATALGLALASGCSGPKTPAWASFNPNNWSNKRIADEPILFDLEGPISVNVETFGGDVIIEGDPEAEQGSVQIVREAVHGWGRSGEARASLADISASAEIVAADVARGELGQTLQVLTSTLNAEPHLQRAHVWIKAPEIETVTVRSDDGDVRITHIEGAVDVEASDGNVRVATNRVMRQPVTIINNNGHIEYRVRGESSGDFDAQTINGRVSASVRYGTLIIQPTTREDLYQAKFNDGANKVILRTSNGDIKIAVVPDAESVITLLGKPNKPPEEDEKESAEGE